MTTPQSPHGQNFSIVRTSCTYFCSFTNVVRWSCSADRRKRHLLDWSWAAKPFGRQTELSWPESWCLRNFTEQSPFFSRKTSPRMGHTLGEIFTHAQSLNLKNRNSWAGRARRSPRALQRAEPARSQRAVVACKLRLKLLLADQPAKKTWKLIVEFVTTKRLVCQNGHSLVEPPSRVVYGIGLCMSLRRNDSFKKFTGARSRGSHHSHFSHGWQNRRSSFCRSRTVREEVRIRWQSRGL